MSRVGSKPIQITPGVNASISGDVISVTGPKGQLSVAIPRVIEIKIDGQNIVLTPINKSKDVSSIHGLTRTLVYNAVYGVSNLWTKGLELVGVGFRGTDLVLNVGFSHPVVISAPANITFSANEGKINVSGIDRQLVGEMAAIIRRVKPPEPYKGKGIRYQGEKVRKKAGKAAKALGGVAGAK